MFACPNHHKVVVAPEKVAAQQGVVVVQAVVVTVVQVVVVTVAGMAERQEAKGWSGFGGHRNQAQAHRHRR